MTLTINIMSYRYGHLAAQAIESVLSQTVKPNIINLFDDGAGDCGHLPEIYPEVDFILRAQNDGIIDNFNDALMRTPTDRVIFLGADNWLAPETVEKCLEHEEDIVSYDSIKFGNGANEYWHLPDFPHGSAMYNVELAKNYMYAATDSGSTRTEEDNVLFTQMLENGASLYIIEEPLLMYRWRHRLNFNQ
jgi:hypothetical protein